MTDEQRIDKLAQLASQFLLHLHAAGGLTDTAAQQAAAAIEKLATNTPVPDNIIAFPKRN
jgi:hypothetical protein